MLGAVISLPYSYHLCWKPVLSLIPPSSFILLCLTGCLVYATFEVVSELVFTRKILIRHRSCLLEAVIDYLTLWI